jgi:RNA polymerase-binding transcription factor DksA
MDVNESRTLLEAEGRRLRELRDRLEQRQLREPDTELSSHDQHQADVASELVEREMGLSILEHVDVGLREVGEALERLHRGTYGSCQQCGLPIRDERLLAVPATRFCVEHERLCEWTGINRSLSEATDVDDRSFAEEIAAREGSRHFEFLPTDDDTDEDLQLGPEELALHGVDESDESEVALTSGDIVEAELRSFEAETDRRIESARDAEALVADEAALEDEQLSPG